MYEIEISTALPARLRYSHAEYFRNQYIIHCGPPIDSYWLMIGYFDAFLFSLASVYDMADRPVQIQLEKIDSFRFFKALRNITAHHSILAATVSGNKFPPPFSRILSLSIGGPRDDSARMFLRLDQLRDILDAVELERPSEKRNIDAARNYISQLESKGTKLYLENLMTEALSAVNAVLPYV